MANPKEDPAGAAPPALISDPPEKNAAVDYDSITLDKIEEDNSHLHKKVANPFGGYPHKPKAKVHPASGPIGMPPEFSATFIVAYTGGVFQDPSNQGLINYHSRAVRDSNGQLQDYVFDRTVGQVVGRCAIVLDDAARANLVYRIDKHGDVVRDERYKPLDADQLVLLHKVFRMANSGELKRLAEVNRFDAEGQAV